MIQFSDSELMLITGASSGIGKATALLCNELGARVVAVGRDKEKLETLKKEAKFPENIFLEARDLAEDLESLVPWVTELKKEHGKFSGFVHSAGHNITAPFKVFDLEESKKMLAVHYHAAMMISKGFSDKRNCTKESSIVFISSVCAQQSMRALSLYAGAKGALQTSMLSMSAEFASQGLRINCVSPALVRTPLVQEYTNSTMGFDVLADNGTYPLGILEPQDVANSIIFLLSSASRKITGQNLGIYGGLF